MKSIPIQKFKAKAVKTINCEKDEAAIFSLNALGLWGFKSPCMEIAYWGILERPVYIKHTRDNFFSKLFGGRKFKIAAKSVNLYKGNAYYFVNRDDPKVLPLSTQHALMSIRFDNSPYFFELIVDEDVEIHVPSSVRVKICLGDDKELERRENRKKEAVHA
jgi:hypothetical protein